MRMEKTTGPKQLYVDPQTQTGSSGWPIAIAIIILAAITIWSSGYWLT